MNDPYSDLSRPVSPATVAFREDAYDAVPSLTQTERVADTFFAPSKTFADIRRNRSWWLPFALLAVLSLVFAGVVLKRVGTTTLAENALHSNPAQAEKLQNAPPEQRASAMRFTAISMQAGLFGGPLFLLLWIAFVALLLWVGFNFILGGSSTYPGMFAVAMYASLPGLLVYLIILVTLFAGDASSFNLASPAGTNIGYYLPTGTSPALKSLLTSLDVFTLWQMILLGLGGAIVARVKVSTGVLLVLGTWLVLVLGKAGIAAAMS